MTVAVKVGATGHLPEVAEEPFLCGVAEKTTYTLRHTVCNIVTIKVKLSYRDSGLEELYSGMDAV